MTRLRVKYDFEKYEDENSEKLVEGFSENKPHETLIIKSQKTTLRL